ncbi:tetraacyldisaccharide 4'-kinase [Pseudaeromonas sharmana]|uniref:Tetraacyldisaccharide 4'-kinase n=1 Tax=Pseudaeromonas sharmana TaxID=328412 RepID=A0ABV8CJM8_9GAMM
MSLAALWYRANWLVWGLWPLALLYRSLTALRRLAYRLGWLRVYRAPVPVIVVGNISVGGNGKTPVVIWLIEVLRQAGYHPGVVSRGYGGRADRYPLQVTAMTPASACGDEPKLIFRRCGCPVVVSPRRAEAIACLLAGGEVDVVISDDGLQHYAMARDIELVVVDGERRFGNGHLLPMGPLREGLGRLAQVDAILCNGGVVAAGEYPMQLIADSLRPVGSSTHLQPPVPGEEVDAMAGIGHPPRFFTTLQTLGYRLRQAVAFADHQAFDLEALQQQFAARPLLMTEKDAVKCSQTTRQDWWYLPVSAQLPPTLLEKIIRLLKEKKHGPRS